MSTSLERFVHRLRRLLRPSGPRRTAAAPPRGRGPSVPTETATRYPGDATGLPDTTYAPRRDGRADPGEIVWTWVPFEEDHTQGKDRPVLVIGREGEWLIALALTSQDHDRDERQERASGREWVDIGTGPWDRQGRPSEVRVNRLIRVAPDAIRREGAVLPRARYDEVIAAARARRR
jgi:hypothetical protein